MYISKSRHGIWYYRKDGRKKSLNTRKKSEATLRAAKILTGHKESCPITTSVGMLAIDHNGAKITIDGETLEHELAIAQGIIGTKISTKKIKEVYAVFNNEKTSDGSWSEKTVMANNRIADHFFEHTGNISVAAMNHEIMNNYKAHLIATKDSIPTINKYLSRVSSFCYWMEIHGYVDKRYGRGMQLKRVVSVQDERERFTLEEVAILFSNLKREKKLWQYWLPLLGYYTGARLNELCQLHCNDVYGGVIDINETGDSKRLKNRSSKRIVPLHSELIRLGFEEFCDRNEFGNANGMVFNLTFSSRDGYSKNPSRWFSHYRKGCGIGSPFHSFRHTFTDELKQAMVTPSVIDELTGHSLKGESMARYGKRYGVEILKEAVEKIPVITTNATRR